MGVVLRYQGPEEYYLWSMSKERPYHALALKKGEIYKVLGKNTSGYDSNVWHEVRMVFDGPRITVFFDGAEDLVVEDSAYVEGKIGLYNWGNTGSEFRKLRFVPEGGE